MDHGYTGLLYLLYPGNATVWLFLKKASLERSISFAKLLFGRCICHDNIACWVGVRCAYNIIIVMI